MNHLTCVSALGKKEHPPGGDFPDQRANVNPVFAIVANFYAIVEVNKAWPSKSFIAEDL